MTENCSPNTRAATANAAVTRGEDGIVRIELAQFLGSTREAIIIHNGEHYRLRITSNGKLILTK